MTGFSVLNPELVIAKMNPEVNLQMVLTINKGRGYVPSEENRSDEAEFGTIAIDSIFTPIRNVKFAVENFRVEQKTDYEKLVLEIDVITSYSIHYTKLYEECQQVGSGAKNQSRQKNQDTGGIECCPPETRRDKDQACPATGRRSERRTGPGQPDPSARSATRAGEPDSS